MGMFKRTNEEKVLRDPIHGYIHISYQVIWDCLNAKEFQRLHRIHQLGGDFQVYHTAEHSRFAHSLGVYEITRRIVSEIPSISNSLSEYEKIQVMCAALLHDIGHGPFSHFFEKLTNKNHEDMGIQIILDPTTEIHQALMRVSDDLCEKVASIINHTHPNKVLSQIISSQLDADRMDYLLRDAYETGTSYGTFDLERILRTMRYWNGKLCVKLSGMHSVEDYIMARYHMYWQVYLHPDAKSYEILIEMFFKRYELIRETKPISVFESLYHEMSSQEFYLMDENRMFYGFQEALSLDDEILKEFASRILDRHLFDWKDNISKEEEENIKSNIKDLEYYYYEEMSGKKALMPYQETNETIWILDSNEEIKPLSTCSEIVKALLKMENNPKKRIYFPKNEN